MRCPSASPIRCSIDNECRSPIDRSVLECQTLDRLKTRYLNYAECGSIKEGTVNFIMLSPLLELLGHQLVRVVQILMALVNG
jgi:hypothetical protein